MKNTLILVVFIVVAFLAGTAGRARGRIMSGGLSSKFQGA